MIGVPYKDGGRDLNGLDCYGAVIVAAKRRGKILNDVCYTNHAPELAEEYAPTLNIKKIEKAEPDALIEMVSGNELHVGLCLDDTTFLHATRKQGVRISRIGSIPIKNYYRIV